MVNLHVCFNSETGNTESDLTSRSQGRESCSDADNLTVGRLGRDYRGRSKYIWPIMAYVIQYRVFR